MRQGTATVSGADLAARVTELEALVRERTVALEDSERRRDELVDVTVHDIKNALCVIDSVLLLMERDPLDGASVLPILRRQSQRIAHLVRTVLDLHALENGTMALTLAEVPWVPLCETVMAESGILAQAKRLALNRSGDGFPTLCCDPAVFERVLINLLDNAIGAAPEGSLVDVQGVRTPDGAFVVRVGNRGPVIAPDVLPTLFVRGRQVATSSRKRLGGWGLGLVFCRLAVVAHGGIIRAISPWVDGEGVAVEITLP